MSFVGRGGGERGGPEEAAGGHGLRGRGGGRGKALAACLPAGERAGEGAAAAGAGHDGPGLHWR